MREKKIIFESEIVGRNITTRQLNDLIKIVGPPKIASDEEVRNIFSREISNRTKYFIAYKVRGTNKVPIGFVEFKTSRDGLFVGISISKRGYWDTKLTLLMHDELRKHANEINLHFVKLNQPVTAYVEGVRIRERERKKNLQAALKKKKLQSAKKRRQFRKRVGKRVIIFVREET